MAVYALAELVPDVHPDAFVHPDAVVIGAVTIGAQASVWPAAVLRGDYGQIRVGERTSIQDGCVIHTTAEWPTVIGAGCVVGHNAHLEGCMIGDGCLVGSGSIVLNRATVEPGGAVAAGALVPEGVVVPAGEIAVGVPARARPAPGIAQWVADAAQLYRDLAERYRSDQRRIG